MTTESADPAPRAEDARRRLAFRLGAEGLAVLVADFLLLRVFGPNLVNLHRDWALAGALFCLALAIALTLWLLARVWRRWPALTRRTLGIASRDPDMES